MPSYFVPGHVYCNCYCVYIKLLYMNLHNRFFALHTYKVRVLSHTHIHTSLHRALSVFILHTKKRNKTKKEIPKQWRRICKWTGMGKLCLTQTIQTIWSHHRFTWKKGENENYWRSLTFSSLVEVVSGDVKTHEIISTCK